MGLGEKWLCIAYTHTPKNLTALVAIFDAHTSMTFPLLTPDTLLIFLSLTVRLDAIVFALPLLDSRQGHRTSKSCSPSCEAHEPTDGLAHRHDLRPA